MSCFTFVFEANWWIFGCGFYKKISCATQFYLFCFTTTEPLKTLCSFEMLGHNTGALVQLINVARHFARSPAAWKRAKSQLS